MKSNKQRRIELRTKKVAKQAALKAAAKTAELDLHRDVLVDKNALGPNNSYSVPDFVMRGYYVDKPFECQACGKSQVWTARQQKWWYVIAKGDVFTTARFCRPCRQHEQARRAEARRIHLEGLARKRTANA